MGRITVVSGSNRKNNKTLYFAKHAYDLLREVVGDRAQFLDLSELDGNLLHANMYKDSEQPPMIREIQDEYFIPASKFWFLVPEYNGSYPGIVKVLLDAMSVRAYAESFAEKKACITGIASGRAGNLRGMDHLGDVLSHLGMYVHPNKNPISSIFKFLNDQDGSVDAEAGATLEKQRDQLVKF